MLSATPEADELQQLPLELPRYLLVALRESGGHRAYALLPPYAASFHTPLGHAALRAAGGTRGTDRLVVKNAESKTRLAGF